jgi:hypothetical protein
MRTAICIGEVTIMEHNRRVLPIRREDLLASILVVIYLMLIFGLVQACVHVSDTANAFVTLH